MSAEHRADARLSRRNFLTAYTALTAGVLLGVAGRARSEPASAGPADPALIEDLVAANRILADQGVVDGYGHVSARHNLDPKRYLLARSMAPELVTAEDIVEFDLDSNPVDPRGRKFYLERFIHGEIYKARPEVKSVVHHHSPAVIPFGVTNVPLRPIYHMAAFVGLGVPVFEIREAGGMTDMLVSTPELGRALARTLGDKPAALMRGHGAVVVGASIPECRRAQRLPADECEAAGSGDRSRRRDHVSRSGGSAQAWRTRRLRPRLAVVEAQGVGRKLCSGSS